MSNKTLTFIENFLSVFRKFCRNFLVYLFYNIHGILPLGKKFEEMNSYFEDQHGCDFHALERRSYDERTAQTGIHPADFG